LGLKLCLAGLGESERRTYAIIDDALVASIVVDVYCDAAEGGDFGGEFGEAGVVLSGWGLLAGIFWAVELCCRGGGRRERYCSRS